MTREQFNRFGYGGATSREILEINYPEHTWHSVAGLEQLEHGKIRILCSCGSSLYLLDRQGSVTRRLIQLGKLWQDA